MSFQADIGSKRAAPVSSFAPLGGLLQRRCACGGEATRVSGECEGCGKKMLQRSAGLLGEQGATAVVRGEIRAPSSSTATEASSTGSRFGHDFSRVSVSSRAPEALEFSRSINNPTRDLIIRGELVGSESGEPAAGTSAEAEEQVTGDSGESAVGAGNANCPVTAVFSSTLAGGEKANCQVPEKAYGAATLARFILQGVAAGAKSTTVTEQFKMLSDNYGVFGLLKPNSYTTSGNTFDDCYILASPKPLPSDLELKVEQNHLLGGKIISKNIVTYTPSRISIRSCKRVKDSCDFATVCRR